MSEQIQIPNRSEEDIKKIVEDFLAGRVFTSTNIAHEVAWDRVFKPLTKLSPEEVEELLSEVGFVFEYFEAGHGVDPETSLPVFSTMQVVGIADAVKIANYVAQEIAAKKVLAPIFPLGELAMTQGVAQAIRENKEFATVTANAMKRHMTGDWGDLSPEDTQRNNQALLSGGRLFSSYNLTELMHGEAKVWIITEADRSVTTILFPGEY